MGGGIEAKGEVGEKRYEDHGERLKGECKKQDTGEGGEQRDKK